MDINLTIKEIESSELSGYIQSAWDNDVLLPNFYDKSLEEKSLKNMVKDTNDKVKGLLEIHEGVKMFGVDYKNEMIGFIVLNKKLNYLYSFGINKNYRNKEVLSEIFSYIKNNIKEFFCLLNRYNSRAVSWLKKCGMTEHEDLSPEKNIIYLKYNLCQ